MDAGSCRACKSAECQPRSATLWGYHWLLTIMMVIAAAQVVCACFHLITDDTCYSKP